MTNRAILIAGPTASGKSGLAIEVAERLEALGGATIINADSMQVYRELRVLTARPSPGDEARAPHRLYGVMPAAERSSAMSWRTLALAELHAAWDAGRIPLVVGGTGLYFKALVEGLAPVPEIPPDVRDAARERLTQLGGKAFHDELRRRDPETASRLDPGDSQRLVRAWEVLEASGIALSEWQARAPEGERFPGERLAIKLDVPRQPLYARIDRRFAAMVEEGAANEVAALDALGLDPSLPAMKAVGVPEFRCHLRGEATLEEAVQAGQTASRRLAKRQMTWLRHQAADWATLDAQHSESLCDRIFPNIRQFLLTGLK